MTGVKILVEFTFNEGREVQNCLAAIGDSHEYNAAKHAQGQSSFTSRTIAAVYHDEEQGEVVVVQMTDDVDVDAILIAVPPEISGPSI